MQLAARESRLGESAKPVTAMKITTYERALFFYLPALVLLVAFAAVCVQAGTPWPWNRIVHEDRQHTLLQTIFYFEHATRELVLDSVLALAVAGAGAILSAALGGRDPAIVPAPPLRAVDRACCGDSRWDRLRRRIHLRLPRPRVDRLPHNLAQ